MEHEAIRSDIEQKLAAKVNADRKLHNVYLLVHSERLGIHWPMAAGQTDNMVAIPDQPFHTASVGKTFTSVIVAKFVENGLAKFDDPIAHYLPESLMKGLHILKGKEYSSDIQLTHLLSNTSGLPDFFEDKPRRHKPFLQEILDEPSRFWTPEETVEWSKEHLLPRFPPGQGFHYTDTGYNLLGLIIESITSKPYADVLHEYIFKPLKMKHSYLSQFSEPAAKSDYPVANLYLDDLKINVEQYRSFSSFYAGGQTVCTIEDLLLFMKALVHNQLLTQESLHLMQNWGKMRLGLKYGYGLMKLQFLPFTEKYTVWGHLGASGSFMLYVPAMDVFLTGSFNQTAYQSKSMNYVFMNILRIVAQMNK
ncbi:beta-lactamase family protein [Alkalihalobacillus clausii]|jgi:D-alanyl-D-alanine carboxypeptidase|uniref:serine hydrolase domain-containing protein n=1 Tax=Shouchella clausii TaxID=79880 RepID=UPI00203C793B|nr:serine hydrolase domain-containing protein [Shouchella clausii]MCM3549489.1 beta-lactamase family protein [Shouchella clausii]